MLKVIKCLLGMVFGLVAFFCLLDFLFMIFVLAMRGVYLSQTAGMFLSLPRCSRAHKMDISKRVPGTSPVQSSHATPDVDTTAGQARELTSQACYPTFRLLRYILLGGLFVCGRNRSSLRSFAPLLSRLERASNPASLSIPHPDTTSTSPPAQAIRYMGFWEIVARKGLGAGLVGGLIAGIIGYFIVTSKRTLEVRKLLLARSCLIGLAILTSVVLMFEVGNGSGMVYYQGHNQFYWCRSLQSDDQLQRREAIPPACELLKGKPFTCRSRTINALAKCGDDAKPTIPVLAELLQDQELVVCSKAAWALTKSS